MKQSCFEKLEVWKEARNLSLQLYRLTADFPSAEKYGMIAQLRRASLSIAANIAEGMSRSTEKDKARFINQAFSSAIEVLNFVIISKDLDRISEELYIEMRRENRKDNESAKQPL